MSKLNFFLIFAFVLALEITSGQTAKFKCPSEDIMNGCDGAESCLYPDPETCKGFIQCDQTGRVFHMKCPKGLEWNQNRKTCDWPQNSNCNRVRVEASTTTTTQLPATPIPGYNCPTGDVAGGCKGSKDCLYPNPSNCSTFIQCTAAGLAYVMPCPSGLQWNDDEKICDWPQQSTCGRTPSPPTTTTTTTQKPTTTTTTTQKPTTTTTTTTTTSSPNTPIPGYNCPAEDVAGGCEGPKDCLYPNPSNCSTFIQCTAAGLAYVMPCPSGLQWNDDEKICDWPQQSTCGRTPSPSTTTTTTTTQEPTTTTTTQEPTTTTVATTTTTSSPNTPIPGYNCPAEDVAGGCEGPKDCLYPNPSNCSTFIQCTAAGLAYVMPCPSGLEWNDNEKICDWPTQSTCPKNSPTTSSTTTVSPTTILSTTGSQSSTTTQTSTTPVCGNDNNSEDADLDLDNLCSDCSEKHLVENPNSQERYIECNGGPDNNTNSIRKCSPGLLFDSNKLTCDYSGLVNSRRY